MQNERISKSKNLLHELSIIILHCIKWPSGFISLIVHQYKFNIGFCCTFKSWTKVKQTDTSCVKSTVSIWIIVDLKVSICIHNDVKCKIRKSMVHKIADSANLSDRESFHRISLISVFGQDHQNNCLRSIIQMNLNVNFGNWHNNGPLSYQWKICCYTAVFFDLCRGSVRCCELWVKFPCE